MQKISADTAATTFGFPAEGYGERDADGNWREMEIYRDVDGEVIALLEVDEPTGGYIVHYASLDF